MACPKVPLVAATILVVPVVTFAFVWAALLATLGLMWCANAIGFI